MPNAADSTIQRILSRSLLTATTISLDLVAQIVRGLDRGLKEHRTPAEMIGLADRILLDTELARLEHLLSSELNAWVSGMDWMADKFPPWLIEEFRSGIRTPPPVDPVILPGQDFPEEIRFPKIEKAAESLQRRGVLTRDDFDEASESAKQKAFTVAGVQREDTIETIRDVLADDVRAGTSLEGFTEMLSDRLTTSKLGPSHTETVYRTNVQAAFRDGRQALVDNPIVQSAFPYQEYFPIHDDRVRETHLQLGTLGLDGTGIYRLDDPFWDYFTPPWDFNCRCGVNLLTKRQAARKGVTEAQLWLESGRAPLRPQHRLTQIPFESRPGFGARTGLDVRVA